MLLGNGRGFSSVYYVYILYFEITGKENVRYGEPIREMSSDKSEIELVEKKNSKAE